MTLRIKLGVLTLLCTASFVAPLAASAQTAVPLGSPMTTSGSASGWDATSLANGAVCPDGYIQTGWSSLPTSSGSDTYFYSTSKAICRALPSDITLGASTAVTTTDGVLAGYITLLWSGGSCPAGYVETGWNSSPIWSGSNTYYSDTSSTYCRALPSNVTLGPATTATSVDSGWQPYALASGASCPEGYVQTGWTASPESSGSDTYFSNTSTATCRAIYYTKSASTPAPAPTPTPTPTPTSTPNPIPTPKTAAPTCSVSFDQNPLKGNATTIRWNSTDANLFYINGIGYVSASGSATVYSAGDYSGTVTGDSGTGSCSAVLKGTDNPPSGGPNGGCPAGGMMCSADGNLHDSCGNTTACQYGCSMVTNRCKQKVQCTSYRLCDASGTRVVDSCTGNTIENCSTYGAGYACIAGQCVVTSISFQSFAAMRGAVTFTATGHLQVSPSLVRSGESTHVFWNVVHAAACTVSATNGDSWGGFSSGAVGKETSAIAGQTTYTLHCNALKGATPRVIDEQVTVNVVPTATEQ